MAIVEVGKLNFFFFFYEIWNDCNSYRLEKNKQTLVVLGSCWTPILLCCSDVMTGGNVLGPQASGVERMHVIG